MNAQSGWISSTGTSFAAVSLAGTVDLSQTMSLALSTSAITFDFGLNSNAEIGTSCLVGTERLDVPLSSSGISARQIAPAGTYFAVTTFPRIELLGGDPAVEIQLPHDPDHGTLVCYRSFLLESFSNADGWSVMASRFDLPGQRHVSNLYIGAACEDGVPSGMSPLLEDLDTPLATNKKAGSCEAMVVVLALKPDNSIAGTSTTGIRYTILSELGDLGARQ